MPADESRPHDSLLVIGYGNVLRSDDGAGILVAEAVAAWGRPDIRGVAVHQLTPELAESLSTPARVVFVDARVAPVGAEPALMALEPSSARHQAGHISDPRSLLNMARWLYGGCAEAWLLTVPGVNFSIGERISATATRGIERAIERIAAMVVEERHDSWQAPGPARWGDCTRIVDDSGRKSLPQL
jgi:hydrogenase maturation protease